MGIKTLVLGASPNPARYSYAAITSLVQAGHQTVAIGLRKGVVAGIEIKTSQVFPIHDLDTITLYVGADRQPPLYDYIFELQPKRIIFNPGAENAQLARLAKEHGIETVYGCTLVMLSLDSY